LSNKKQRHQCLVKLKGLVKDDPTLENFADLFEDPFLKAFIIGKNYDVELAHKTLKNYINVRRHKYRYIFSILLPSTNKSIEAGVLRKLRARDSLNRVVILNRIRHWTPSEIPHDDVVRHFMLIMDQLMLTEVHDSEGVVAVFDLKGFSKDHALVCNPASVYLLVQLLWKNCPIKIKALHIVNEGFLFKWLLTAVRHFLPPKVKERLHLHSGNYSTLHDHLCRNMLPSSLGGTLEEEDDAFDDKFEERIRSREEYYQRFKERL